MRKLLCSLILAAGVCLLPAFSSAEPLSHESALFKWTPTTDATIRYELRTNNFLHPEWQTLSTDLDSTTGEYLYTFPEPFADSTGDRFICFDMRAHFVDRTENSNWASETTSAGCNQIPLAPVLPPPVPGGLQIVSATPEQIIITASVNDCPRIITSTKGSTVSQLKRTVTCTH